MDFRYSLFREVRLVLAFLRMDGIQPLSEIGHPHRNIAQQQAEKHTGRAAAIEGRFHRNRHEDRLIGMLHQR